MRRGISPAKRAGLMAHIPGEIGVASLVFIPSLTGFYARSLEVLDWHLKSLRSTLPQGEIWVWDNGSALEVKRFLQQRLQQGQIDYLMLSQYNLGKTGALNWILAAMPHRYIAFSDGDILFLPGWWEAVQKIFQAFPKAGMVSPAPAFFDVLRGKSRTASLLKTEGFQVYLDTLSDRDIQLYYQGLGYEIPENLPTIPLVKAPDGTIACAQSGHHVFVMPQEVARAILPLPVDRALSSQNLRVLHERIENLGYWQLSTAQTFIYHLGNTPLLPSLIKKDIYYIEQLENRKTPASKAIKTHSKGVKGWILSHFRQAMQHFPRLRKSVERIYNVLFRLLYEDE